MPSPGAAQHNFSVVPTASIERSVFDRSHGYKTTFNEGYLVPFYVDEVLPGDTFNLQATMFARLTTPIKPLMDNMWLESWFFFVPYRLLWTNFKKFMGEQDNPGDSTSFTVPQSTYAAALATGSVEDYLGLPIGVAGLSVSALPRRAYIRIYNEWFRDENLVNSGVVSYGDGPDALAWMTPFRRGKRHDYFTSCLPWTQKGTAVSIGAPVVPATANAIPTFWNITQNSNAGQLQRSAAGALTAVNIQNPGGGVEALGWNQPNLVANPTVTSLRQAFQVQKLLERDARGGTRYTEKIFAHFHVKSPDARLQRSEYLGGGSTPVNISAVPQTAPTSAGVTPQGNLAAFGTVTAHGHGFHKSFTEHGIVLGICCVRAELTYQQGIERFWSRSTVYDFYWPALAHISEQPVYNREIYADGSGNDALVFGYQEAYADYRYKPSKITGQFRSTAATPLDMWHLAQKFTALPTLGQTFIEENAPMSRVVAVTTEPHFYFDSYIKLKCARPMPVFGVPGLIDHF